MSKPAPQPSGLQRSRRKHPGVPREFREEVTPESEGASADVSPKNRGGRPKGATSTPESKKITTHINMDLWEESQDLLAFTKSNPRAEAKNFRELVDLAILDYIEKGRKRHHVGERFPARGN